MLLLALMLLNSGVWMLLEGTTWEWFGQKRFNPILHPTFCPENARWNMSICDPDNKLAANFKRELEQIVTLIKDKHECYLTLSIIKFTRATTHFQRLRFPFNKIHSNFLSNQSTALEHHKSIYFYVPFHDVVLFISILPQKRNMPIPLIDALSVGRCAMPLAQSGEYEEAVQVSLGQLDSLMTAAADRKANLQQ